MIPVNSYQHLFVFGAMEMKNAIELFDNGKLKDFSVDLAMEILDQQDEYDFCVDFDVLWQWVGYSRKDNAKTKLVKEFEENQDYTLLNVKERVNGNNGGGSVTVQKIFLTADCAKEFAMMAGTSQGKLVRKYFIEAEKQLRELQKKLRSMSPMEFALWSCQQHVEAERRLHAIEATQKQQNNRLEAVEAEVSRFQNGRGFCFTVIAWGIKHGIKLDLSSASVLGRFASRYCRENGLEKTEVNDPVWGNLGVYPQEALIYAFDRKGYKTSYLED